MTDAVAHPQLLAKHRQSVTPSSEETAEDSHRYERALAALNDYPCGGQKAAGDWLGQADVAAALHVNVSMASKGMKYNWGPSSFSGDLRPLYKTLIPKYRMMIYSGDTDACIPFWGTDE
jgi:hypothetical protein